jgi:membrane protein YdbS with pleckstrin-like domain
MNFRQKTAEVWQSNYKTFLVLAIGTVLWAVMKLLGVPMTESRALSGGIAVIGLGVIVAVWVIFHWYRFVFRFFQARKTTVTGADTDGKLK